jgi:SHO1 osmosensor
MANGSQLVGYLSAGLVITTLAVNNLIYQSDPAKQSGAAGFILLSIVIVSKIALRAGSREHH